jgi:hypothetical protein
LVIPARLILRIEKEAAMDRNSVRKQIAQSPLLLTQLEKVPTLIRFREEEVDGRFYALLLALAITLHLERALAKREDVDGLSKEMANALANGARLSALAERAWEHLVQIGYWIPYYLFAYSLEEGGLQGAMERAVSYRRQKELGLLILDALVLGNRHLVSEFGKKGQ